MEEMQFNFEKHGLTYISEIAQTHQGKVRIYQVKKDDKYYALKVILKSYLDDQTKIRFVLNEKEALIALNHPGIIKLVQTIKDESHICLLLELVYGCPLHEILRIEKKIDSIFVKFIGIQFALILDYIHSQGYLYRDIKASNIIIDKEGRIKLVDMGFAKKIDKERTYSFCGTLHAMAPEFFTNLKEGYSYEVDIYAFGILLFELVLGQPPFGYITQINKEFEEQVISGIRPDQLERVYDKELRELIAGLLEVDREKRIGRKNGFKDVICHPFFKEYETKKVQKFIEGASLSESGFEKILDNCELYLETAYISGIRPESPEEENANDPFKQFF